MAAAARRFVVIASEEKAVSQLTAPVPLELLSFGAARTLLALSPASLRAVPASPDGGLIADYEGPIEDPGALAAWLSATPGVIDHGLFAPTLTSTIMIVGEQGLKVRAGAKPSS